MSERLPRIGVHNKNWGDFEVEESTWHAVDTMLDMDSLGCITLASLGQISLEGSCTVLMRIHNLPVKGAELR